LDEAFVVCDEIWMKLLDVYWVVKYDEILDESFVVCDEIWMKLLDVYWVVKYD
jgi:hypothetical protein